MKYIKDYILQEAKNKIIFKYYKYSEKEIRKIIDFLMKEYSDVVIFYHVRPELWIRWEVEGWSSKGGETKRKIIDFKLQNYFTAKGSTNTSPLDFAIEKDNEKDIDIIEGYSFDDERQLVTPDNLIEALKKKNMFTTRGSEIALNWVKMDLIVLDSLKKKSTIDYWNKKIEKDLMLYKKIKDVGIDHPEIDKKWKHLGLDFGILDN